MSSVAVIASAIIALGGLIATGSPGYAATPPPQPVIDQPSGAPAVKQPGTETFIQSDEFALRNLATLWCLDDSDLGLRTFPCNPDSYNNGFQRWRVRNPGQLQNLKTLRCLDDSDLGLRTFPCNPDSYNNGFQKWLGFDPGPLKNAATLRCLDDSFEFGVRTFPCNPDSLNNGFQAWKAE